MVNKVSPENSWYLILNEPEVSSPALLIYPDRIENNIRQMIRTTGNVKRLRPHVKSHKTPEILRMHMNEGIDSFKCATIAEAEMVAGCGAKDVLLAMQPVGPNMERFFILKQRFPETKLSCIADSEDIAGRLSEMAEARGEETHVWIDINNGNDRTGIIPGDKAIGLARKITGLPMLTLEGLHIYDGHIREKDIRKRQTLCDAAFAPVDDMVDRLAGEGINGMKIIAGGSTTFTVHAMRKGTECSPGTTVLWDYGYSMLFPDMSFLHAAVLFTRIVSKPAKGLICVDLGHKAVASEMPQPRIVFFGLKDYSIVSHSEEHMVVETSEADDLKVGDSLYGIPWHICPTTDRFDKVSVVNGNNVTGEWDVVARKRKLKV